MKNHETFVVAGDEDYNEESENEMIKPGDLNEIESLKSDEDKFRALHSHVEHYNRRSVELINSPEDVDFIDPTVLEKIKEVNIFDDPEPFTAGYQHEFVKLSKRQVRKKREDEYESNSIDPADYILITLPPRTTRRPITQRTSSIAPTEDYTDLESTSTVSVSPTELTERENIHLHSTTSANEEQFNTEEYDYELFKSEYYQQLEDLKNKNMTYNFTDKGEPEDTPKDAFKKIIEFKSPRNCTKEELTQIGAKAFECLVFDYKNAKGHMDIKRVLTRSWLILRIWLLLYICIAVPAWCQKGWCCCCFRCNFCFPLERIEYVKRYYANNPPGIFEQNNGEKVEYKPTAFELDAYEKLESAIRNL